ncbi:hypothetical protein F444_15270 [Phytophthora nicotianae P1976]|uniref:FAR1 domain-containing protein n=1 Tax=Phytophthora nicotianae P1976 TaxID=1317066 RepID=A0A080ZMJ2_PHYNI|nr:hypothetical protein F444_15270 [Phytophthora nicotianae P1976]
MTSVAATPTLAGASTQQTLVSPARASTTQAQATRQRAERVVITAQGEAIPSPAPIFRRQSSSRGRIFTGIWTCIRRKRSRCSTKSVAERNKQIDSAKKSSSEIIPPDWGTYAKTIICTHGGKHRYRGKGKRPRQEVRPMGCMTQINVCVQLVSEQPSKFAVCVSKTALTHNHKLGLRSYEHYAANRMSVNGEVLETVDSLWKAGAKTKSILKFIVENADSNPTPQDAQNLIRNMKKRAQGGMTRSHRIKSGCWTFARFLATWVVYLWTRPTKRESQLALRSKRNTLWIYSTDSQWR